jgi:hypothetical protein
MWPAGFGLRNPNKDASTSGVSHPVSHPDVADPFRRPGGLRGVYGEDQPNSS